MIYLSMNFQEQINASLRLALETLSLPSENISLEHPADNTHGDYSSNIALTVFNSKDVQVSEKYKSHKELAEKIVALLIPKFKNPESIISKIEIAGPGFINFYLSEDALSKELQLAIEQGERYGTIELATKHTMVLDHSHPNIAKRFGVGHLRSTIIGNALANIYKFNGWNVVAVNFLGDWGTQFGSIIAAIKEQGLSADNLTIDELERIYVDFNKRAKEDPKLWDLAKLEFKRLEDGDVENRKTWEIIKNISMVEFENIWDLLGVEFDHMHAESFFEDKMPKVITDAKKKGLAVISEGALVVYIPGFENPLLLVKSDGATTYEARDLAAIAYWAEEFKPDIIAYEVGSEQSLHFKQVFEVADMLGYFDKSKLIHIQHGLYLAPDGKKMRTRTGQTVRLEEVLNEAVERARKLVNKPDTREQKEDISDEEKEQIAKSVGIGAVKYFDLSHHHESNIIFDWDQIFQLDGNSSPYIQYTHARTQSILDKANDQFSSSMHQIWDLDFENIDFNAEEISILRHIYKFSEIISESAKSYSPNLLCNFLFELAQKYNTLYNKHRILDLGHVEADGEVGENGISEQEESDREQMQFRLALTKVTGNILKTGLDLLGIDAPERM